MLDDSLSKGNSRLIMARIGAVLDPSGNDNITPSQKELFELVTNQVAKFNADRKCPIVSVFDHVGNYWRNWLLLILRTSRYRPSTIMRLLEAIDPSHPISYRMLTLNLRMLERDGLIERRKICDQINHVQYSLTPLGQELSDKILSLVTWVEERAPVMATARLLFDAEEEMPRRIAL